MWKLDHKESWALKNQCFWIMLLNKTLESPLDCKDIQPVSPKGNQSWIFIGRTHAEAEIPILWPLDAKNWLIWKDHDAGKDWSWEEKGMTEDEMVRWHHQLTGHEFEFTLAVGDGQGGLACCSPWITKSQTGLSNWTELNYIAFPLIPSELFYYSICSIGCSQPGDGKIVVCPTDRLNWTELMGFHPWEKASIFSNIRKRIGYLWLTGQILIDCSFFSSFLTIAWSRIMLPASVKPCPHYMFCPLNVPGNDLSLSRNVKVTALLYHCFSFPSSKYPRQSKLLF